jgi:hypothetical protein
LAAARGFEPPQAESKSVAFGVCRLDIGVSINLKLQAQFQKPPAESGRFHLADDAKPY